MVRQIIKIDREKCNGCGICIEACHEGAIAMIGGKAQLLRDDYCDGLGDCLPVCPTGAITFEEREALEFDGDKVKKKMEQSIGCPGMRARSFERREIKKPDCESLSELQQWPVQIKLIPVNAPYFEGANLLVAADCTAYAYGRFHREFMKNKVVIIGCPKLDDGDYSEKLTSILKSNSIKSVTVVRMEVPCCGGIENSVISALQNSKKIIPWRVITISTDGNIIE